MAYLDHAEAYRHFRDRTLEGITEYFPVHGKIQSLHLDHLEVDEGKLGPDDIRAQLAAKNSGVSWAAPVYATMSLKNNATGHVIDKKKIRIAEVPMVTQRYSQIIDGQEYQVGNQWRLKPGVYVKRGRSGELAAKFNVPNKSSFDISFKPDTKLFMIKRGSSEAINAYPIMKTMGVTDDQLSKSWGHDVFIANKNARGTQTAVDRFFKVDKKRAPVDKEEAEKHVYDVLTASILRPEATSISLGKPFSNVTGEALHLATQKILKVQAGHPEDDRDSLVFKDLHTAGDFAYEKITNWKTKNAITGKFARKVNTATGIRDVVKFDTFNKPIRETFTKNSAAEVPDQINPVEMMAAAQQTTIMGPGGIQSTQQVNEEAKFINPSSLGFIDPVRTPEGEKTGINSHLPMGVRKVGHEAKIPLYNLRSHQTEMIGPGIFVNSRVVLPDQVSWKDGKPQARYASTKMSGPKNAIEEGKFSSADYVLKHPSQLFNITTNLIPFLGNNSGNRATYATYHIEQAIPLVHREAPLVQSATGASKEGIRTFEEIAGKKASHVAPVAGHVHSVKDDAVVVRDAAGKMHEVQLYRYFPLNDPKSYLHSTPVVKVGDKVAQGQVVADTNFTKGGVLALGTNLRAAYLPYRGYNFEDGVVISATAAKKLTSEHMHKPTIRLDDKIVTSPEHFQVEHPGSFTQEQFKKLDSSGVVKVGQTVTTGDPLVIAMRPFNMKDRTGASAIRRSLSGSHTDVSLRWTSDHPGEVVGVHRKDKDSVVHVRTLEPMQVGDKIAGRYGNKGIVTLIVPDHNMPHTKDGKPTEILLNPSGVPGRMNIGQVLETAATKVAKKTGKPYLAQSFAPLDQLEQVKRELHTHGISDTEELHDPISGKSLGTALVGQQHILKLAIQIDKKISARSGMGLPGTGHDLETYDMNLMPVSGAKTGGQSIGMLGLNALLAHGAKANIREMQTWKSEGVDPQTNPSKRWESQHLDVWGAIQNGTPLPTPRPTFAFHKFTEMLKAAGVNIEKKGNQFQLSPLTDKQVLSMSKGELPRPMDLTHAKLDDNGEPKPKTGGLFDPRLTGGHGGKNWTHIKLAEPVPNPVFEGAIQKVLGLSKTDYQSIVSGDKAISRSGAIVALGAVGADTGGAGIKRLLQQIDVKKDLKKAEAELESISIPKGTTSSGITQKVDKLVKKVKYLRALDASGVHPADAYVLHNLPILPPALRPASVLPDGTISWADMNGLYSQFAQVNEQLKDPVISKNLSDTAKKQLRADLYDGMRAIVGQGSEESDQKGVLLQIHGSQPKKGFFQQTLLSRKQDLSMRSVIVPEPSLSIDQVGLPRSKATTLFRPFVVRKLVEIGAARSPIQAQELIAKKDPSVDRALDLVMEERPVLMKRDPALHRHSVMAFNAKAVPGRAIQIHPLVTTGYNADFDGDTMSVYVPISNEAVAEARKMMPSNHLFNEATGHVMFVPTLESALGMYKMSLVNKKVGNQSFAKTSDALKAVQSGTLHINDLATIAGTKTTAGRVLLADSLPKEMQKKILEDHSHILDEKNRSALFTHLAKNHSGNYGAVADKLKDLGTGMSMGVITLPHPDGSGPAVIKSAENYSKDRFHISVGAHSLSLKDIETDRAVRDPILKAAQKEVDAINSSTSIPTADKERRAILVWTTAADKLKKDHLASDFQSNLLTMQRAGVKPGWTQYKQLVLAPLLVADASGKIVPVPIRRSYSEGVDVGEYWTQMQGARAGNLKKVQEVREPGFFSKKLVNSTMSLVINVDDCGTHNGIALPATSNDVQDRTLVKDFSAKGMTIPAGTLLSPDMISQIRAADKDAHVVVRSPLKCEQEKGLCQKCTGLSATGVPYPIGTNIGLLSAQALGERSVQLTMKAFHTGGVVAGGAKTLSAFAKVDQLTKLPDVIPDSASLAMHSGKIDKIEKDQTGVKVWIGGHAHHVGKDRTGMPLHEILAHSQEMEGFIPWKAPKVGEHVEAGESLSDPNRTTVNPHQLYKATGSIERVQNFLTKELHGSYSSEGIRRQHVELLVKSMSNLTKVRDPGDSEGIIKGEFHPTSVIKALNAKLVKEGKQPVEHSPVLMGVDMMPLKVQEDWMAKMYHNRLRETVMEAAATGARSDIHGIHPIPGAAYGAEFGYTEAQKLEPGLHHLKDVPRYAY